MERMSLMAVLQEMRDELESKNQQTTDIRTQHGKA